MRTSLALASAALALAASSGGAAAPARPKPLPLLPLSDADQQSSKEMGCTAAFYQGDRTYIQLINRELMIRTAAGLQVCHLTEKQDELFSDAHGSVSCGGRTLAIRRTGRVTDHPEADSSEGPAMLTVTIGKAATPIRGNWGAAC